MRRAWPCCAGPRTSGSAAYSSNGSDSASKTPRDSSACASPAAPLACGGLVQRRAQQSDLREVVEVPGLQRGVLPVVGEAQELARLRAQVESLCSSISARTARIVVAVLRLSTPSVASFARSDRCVLRIGDAAGRLKAEQKVAGGSSAAGMPCALGDDSSGRIDEDRLGQIALAHRAGSAPCRRRPVSFMNAGKRAQAEPDRRPSATAPWPRGRGSHHRVTVVALFAAVFARRESAALRIRDTSQRGSTPCRTVGRTPGETAVSRARQASRRSSRIPGAAAVPARWWPTPCRHGSGTGAAGTRRSETGSTRSGADPHRASRKRAKQLVRSLRVSAGELGELQRRRSSCPRRRRGALANEPTGLVFGLHSEGRLDPTATADATRNAS